VHHAGRRRRGAPADPAAFTHPRTGVDTGWPRPDFFVQPQWPVHVVHRRTRWRQRAAAGDRPGRVSEYGAWRRYRGQIPRTTHQLPGSPRGQKAAPELLAKSTGSDSSPPFSPDFWQCASHSFRPQRRTAGLVVRISARAR
jgi:hypothetical protein